YDFTIAAAEVLPFAGACESAVRKCFEPHKQTAQTGGGRLFDHIIAHDGVDRGRALKDTAHTSHAAEKLARKPGIPEKMIVEEVKVSAGKPFNLGQRIVH